MTHGSLFSGIGGFDLAAEWTGWENVFNCEWEEFPRKVLKHHFPNAKQHEDIKDLDATEYYGRIDVLSGGFPCQPFSVAGKRKGTEDDRYLWKEMLRVIRECSPRYVVGENVAGLVGWSNGMVLEEVCADLENIGYSVQPYLIPACAKNAPHKRMRIWFVAYSNINGKSRTSRRDESESKSEGVQERDKVQLANESSSLRGINAPDTHSGRCETNYALRESKRKVESTRTNGESISPDTDNARTNERVRDNGNGEKENEGRNVKSQSEFRSSGRNATDTDSKKRHRGSCTGESKRKKGKQRGDGIQCAATRFSKKRNAPDTDSASRKGERINRQRKRESFGRSSESIQDRWEVFPTVPPICGGDDGLPKELDGITFPKWRRESIKAYGNAIVPQVAHSIFEAIDIMDREFNALDVN